MKGAGHVNGPWPPELGEAAKLCVRLAADEPEVSAAARARVWSRVAGRERARIIGYRAGWPALAAASLAVGLYAWRSSDRREPPREAATAATRTTRWSGAERQRVALPGVADLVLGEHGAAALVDDGRPGVTIRLERGSLLLHVLPRPTDAPLRVLAPRAEVRVLGTVLRVTVAVDGATTVSVGHGAVEVHAPGLSPVRVAAGERWPAGADAPAAPTAEELASLGPLADPVRFPADRIGAAALRLPGAPDRPARTTGRPICAGVDGTEGEACLERLAGGRDRLRAETALFELGWRRLHERADAAGALAAFRRQRRAFPSGALREDADASIVEALGQPAGTANLKRARERRQEIDRYLAAHPDGMAAPEMHYLRGEIALGAGDCTAAARDFARALRTPATPWASRARDGLARCGAPRPGRAARGE